MPGPEGARKVFGGQIPIKGKAKRVVRHPRYPNVPAGGVSGWFSAWWHDPEKPLNLPRGVRVQVTAGDLFPVGGVVALGEGDTDESLLTGEPILMYRKPGDRVFARTVSVGDIFRVEGIPATRR